MIDKSYDIIKAEALEKTYEDNGVPVKALRGVDLEIKKGEFLSIVGPSGSGKTTLLNIISGLDDPSKGEVYLNNKLISSMSGRELSDFRRDNIGFIFQSHNLIPVLSVEENIEYIMLLQRVPKEERHKRVENILRDVGLEGFADRFPTQLSGGQQQRVAIARAMVSRPALILADEPTASLDSKTGSELLDIMRSLNEKRDMTFIFSTHDKLVMDKARRLIVLKDGQIESDEVKK
ncbi:MAG: ABC transporter ATP-binding protein [Candidatus Zixiibacteriota bacterium]|nr:MAG: ABC transporter ATP-binding protein [candidate division Zixibacteria bacterium]